MKLENCINFLLAKAYQKVNSQFKASLKKYGITPVQYAVLHLLWENDELTSSQLSNALLLDNSTITGITERLIQNKFITRKEDISDRRKIILSLTEKGKSLEREVLQCIDKLNNDVLCHFKKEEIDTLKTMLRKIIFE